jgi:hypothetical protein
MEECMSNKVMRSKRFKKFILELAEALGSDAKAYREFEMLFFKKKYSMIKSLLDSKREPLARLPHSLYDFSPRMEVM